MPNNFDDGFNSNGGGVLVEAFRWIAHYVRMSQAEMIIDPMKEGRRVFVRKGQYEEIDNRQKNSRAYQFHGVVDLCNFLKYHKVKPQDCDIFVSAGHGNGIAVVLNANSGAYKDDVERFWMMFNRDSRFDTVVKMSEGGSVEYRQMIDILNLFSGDIIEEDEFRQVLKVLTLKREEVKSVSAGGREEESKYIDIFTEKGDGFSIPTIMTLVTWYGVREDEQKAIFRVTVNPKEKGLGFGLKWVNKDDMDEGFVEYCMNALKNHLTGEWRIYRGKP